MTNIIFHESKHGAPETLDKITEAIKEKGLNVFATIKHGDAAAKNGLELRDTSLIIFGNPMMGTTLMQADQRMGLELPMKILVWQDAAGKVFAGFRDPELLLSEYELDSAREVVAKAKSVLTALVQSAG